MNTRQSGSRRLSELHPYVSLLHEMDELMDELKAFERKHAAHIERTHPNHRDSVLNLLHYLGYRRCDMKSLRLSLSAAGLSSLGSIESQVMGNLAAIHALLSCAAGEVSNDAPPDTTAVVQPVINASNLFGNAHAGQETRIMLTIPAEAADDHASIKNMLELGMDCAHIDCAQGTPKTWARMVEQIRLACRETGKNCRILLGLVGPKLCTGEIAKVSAALKIKPKRDNLGRVTAPARILLHPEGCDALAEACLPVQGDWLSGVSQHDIIELTDARGSVRTLKIAGQKGMGYWAESTQTAYITPGTELKLIRVLANGHTHRAGRTGRVGELAPQPESIRLHIGDRLHVTREALPGTPARFDAKGRLLQPASISCSLPEVFRTVQPGDRILFDGGKICGVICNVNKNRIVAEITHAREEGEKLLAGKTISLPDSRLEIGALTKQDIEHLEFAVKHADMVALPFVRNAADIKLLQKNLHRLGADKTGILLKIETRAAFECLPELLLTLMRSPSIGLIIESENLAVECAHESPVRLLEDVLLLAQAAHLPVIRTVQTPEELSDIVETQTGVRAACVMLNGNAADAVKMLDDMLRQKKRTPKRRPYW